MTTNDSRLPTASDHLAASAAEQSLWAQTLLDAFAVAGVRDVVISPGSRSTPFVLAACEHPQLNCHDIFDERSAAYFALGQARITDRPTLLLCTSGTAVANYFPAVVEAAMAYVPLLVLSADRPVELVDCGANQTIDQLKIFGSQARDFVDLGSADTTPRALRAMRRRVAQAVFCASYPTPGAVHLNARAKKPLQPLTAAVEPRPEPQQAASSGPPAAPQAEPKRPKVLPARDDLKALAARLNTVERGLIVLGPGPISQAAARSGLHDLIETCGFLVFADPASQFRFGHQYGSGIDAYDSLLQSDEFRRRWRPEMILQIGRVPTSGAFDRYLEELVEVEHWVLAPQGWNDPQSTANHLLFGDLAPTLESLNALLDDNSPRDDAWADAWHEADRRAGEAIAAQLDGSAPSSADAAQLREGQIARQVVDALPNGGLLALGNSLPIRQVDQYCPGGSKHLAVASQRGTSGIDGVVSGALGAATQHQGPTVLLIGDISFLHDLSGLAAAHLVSQPLIIVVVQNQGGRIFEQLPVSGHLEAATSTSTAEDNPSDDIDASAMRHWLTPHDVRLGPAAALFGIPFQRVDDVLALRQALVDGLARPGVSLVEAVVPPHGAAEDAQRLRQQVREALADAGLT